MQEIVELLRKSVENNTVIEGKYKLEPSDTYKLGDLFFFIKFRSLDYMYLIVGDNKQHYYIPIRATDGLRATNGFPTGEIHKINGMSGAVGNVYKFPPLFKEAQPHRIVGDFIIKGV